MAVRTCAACRSARDPRALIRLCAGPDGLVHVDYRGRLPGRGAWVDPERRCVEKLERRSKILQRALRGPVRVDGLAERVRAANLQGVAAALSLAARSGLLRGGREHLRGALSRGDALALVLAADISPRREADLRSRATEIPAVSLPWSTLELGQRVGRGPRAALVVGRGKAGQNLLRELRRLEALR